MAHVIIKCRVTCGKKCSIIVLNHILFVCNLYFQHRKSFRLSGRIMGTLPYSSDWVPLVPPRKWNLWGPEGTIPPGPLPRFFRPCAHPRDISPAAPHLLNLIVGARQDSQFELEATELNLVHDVGVTEVPHRQIVHAQNTVT